MKQKQISPERKGVYYIGKGLSVVGMVTFFSIFVLVAMNSGNIHDFDDSSIPVRAVVGFALIAIGMWLQNIGEKGLAGSGVILDPEKARKDLEPWARMGGGVVKDALDEAGIRMNESGKNGAELPFDEQLRRLHKLLEDGIISNDEYQEKKKRILEK
jgi:hypothetical protein